MAQLCYIAAFCRQLHITWPRAIVALGLLISTVIVVWVLTPNLDQLIIPMYTYMAVIAFMALSATLGKRNHWLVAVGAISFIISDPIITLNLFVTPIPGARYFIMATYYVAQFLLTTDARRGT